jgi:exonuclease VII large subunit
MPLPALQLLEQKLEKQKRLFELRRGALEKTIEQHIQLFEQRKGALEKKIEHQFETHKKKFEQKFDTQKKKIETRIRRFEQKNGIRLDDEVRFIRSWIEKPLTTGAVTPSGRALARTMAS